MEGTEACDDGGVIDGDGCSSVCTIEANSVCDSSNPSECSTCGDGVIELFEQCDDGNLITNDGCDASCNIEADWVCDGADPTDCYK